jgi:hypothetical protein
VQREANAERQPLAVGRRHHRHLERRIEHGALRCVQFTQSLRLDHVVQSFFDTVYFPTSGRPL